jgi:hypothetical protein
MPWPVSRQRVEIRRFEGREIVPVGKVAMSASLRPMDPTGVMRPVLE